MTEIQTIKLLYSCIAVLGFVLGRLHSINEKLETERDAAIRDLEEIMSYGGRNVDTCRYCATEDCYGRGGSRMCDPKWRGRK